MRAADDLHANAWAFGPWCYPVAEVIALPAPLQGIKGMLGLWALPPEVRAVILAQTGHDVEHGMTLQQPYASAIAYGPKRVENRPQRRHLPPEGKWVAIHAGLSLYCPDHWLRSGRDAGDSVASIRHLYVTDLLDLWRHGDETRAMWPDAPATVEALPLAAILGIMRLMPAQAYGDPDER